MAYESNDKKMDSVYGKRIKAGKRRTYFFDVRSTRGNDYFLTITESRKRFNDDGYDRHKIFLYKEDFNKFLKALNEAVDYVKTELMPDFDFDAYNHDTPPASEENGNGYAAAETTAYASPGETTYASNEEATYASSEETAYAATEETATTYAAAEEPAYAAAPAEAEQKIEEPAVNPGDNGATEEVDKW